MLLLIVVQAHKLERFKAAVRSANTHTAIVSTAAAVSTAACSIISLQHELSNCQYADLYQITLLWCFRLTAMKAASTMISIHTISSTAAV
jgi:hypothetical protein